MGAKTAVGATSGRVGAAGGVGMISERVGIMMGVHDDEKGARNYGNSGCLNNIQQEAEVCVLTGVY